MDSILTCQGSGYTQKMHGVLRDAAWKGFWIDAASALRMSESSIIVLDPLNDSAIEHGIQNGTKDFIGGNCTVSLMLMAVGVLFQEGLVEWATSMTYQAISGAGAKAMQTLVAQMQGITQDLSPAHAALELEHTLRTRQAHPGLPTDGIGATLAGSLLPWIDSAMENGQTREEYKAAAEANKILQTKIQVPIDGTCVRVGSLRAHAQALTLRLTQDIPLKDIEAKLKSQHNWLRWVPNNKDNTFNELTPVSVAGSLDIAVGRVRKLAMGPQYLNVFTVGDQLLWGAAEPLRRMLSFLI
jgi:aspartate-semialdehyde dehydrogenase